MTRILAGGGVRVFGVALLLLALAVPRGVSAAAMSYDGAIDVTAALDEAGRTWDLSREDAVFLLESARFTWFEDGRLREERHRLLWISTDWAQETYADFRLPWDSDRQTLNVKALRVLRDGRWIEARPTAIVDTTPFALRNAPDYSAIRETMLLYDGIELPCVLECAYVIEDKIPFRAGFEGVWTFHHADPALESRLILEGPTEASVRSTQAGGAPVGERTRAEGNVMTYVMRRQEPAPGPAGDDPAADLPRVTWSTFDSWRAMGRSLTSAFEERLPLDGALRDSLAAMLDGAPSELDRAHRIAEFLNERQRRVPYEPACLSALARPAPRVFDTGYGGDLDLIILAGALYREAGFTVEPAFVGRGYGPIDEGLPTLARLGAPGLWIARRAPGETIEAYWDPATGHLVHEGAGFAGRALWRGATDETPAVRDAAAGAASWSSTHLDLRWSAEKKSWSGSAWFEARGAANPYDRAAMGGGTTKASLVEALGEVFDGLDVASFDPVWISPERFAVRAEVTSGEVERDEQGRVALLLGASAEGIGGSLPHDVVLHEKSRSTPVRGISGEHTVRVRLDLGGLQVVHLPEPIAIENEAGAYRLDVKRGEKDVVYAATVRVKAGEVPASVWPALRALLLAERDPARRTVLLR
jgi:hypothetical protein